MCRTFYHYNRDTMPIASQKKTLPGPGMYRLPSDFGYYESNAGVKYSAGKKPRRRVRSVEVPKRHNKPSSST